MHLGKVGPEVSPDQPLVIASSDGGLKLEDGMSTICLTRAGVIYLQEKLESLKSFLGTDRKRPRQTDHFSSQVGKD